MSSIKAILEINESLKAALAPLDAKVLEKSQEWAMGRKEALKEFKASEEYAALRGHAHTFTKYQKMFDLCGGKTWYSVFTSNNDQGINEFVEKNCQATAAKRNMSISKKLEKAGVSELLSQEYYYSNDGFNGAFAVVTDKGRKVVTVDTIYAGGYNIQCLHLRVLVKIK